MARKEFHHFQFIDPNSGDMPLSITLLVRYHYPEGDIFNFSPISVDELLELDETMEKFGGDFIKSFQNQSNQQHDRDH